MITVQPSRLCTCSCESFVQYYQGRKRFQVSNAALPYSAHKKACCDILHDLGLQHASPVSHVLLQVLQRTYLKRTKIVLHCFHHCVQQQDHQQMLLPLHMTQHAVCLHSKQNIALLCIHSISTVPGWLVLTPDSSCLASLLQLVRSTFTAVTQSCSMGCSRHCSI